LDQKPTFPWTPVAGVKTGVSSIIIPGIGSIFTPQISAGKLHAWKSKRNQAISIACWKRVLYVTHTRKVNQAGQVLWGVQIWRVDGKSRDV